VALFISKEHVTARQRHNSHIQTFVKKFQLNVKFIGKKNWI